MSLTPTRIKDFPMKLFHTPLLSYALGVFLDLLQRPPVANFVFQVEFFALLYMHSRFPCFPTAFGHSGINLAFLCYLSICLVVSCLLS